MTREKINKVFGNNPNFTGLDNRDNVCGTNEKKKF